jgi:hypothetical protein
MTSVRGTYRITRLLLLWILFVIASPGYGQLVWTNWDNGQSIGSFFGVAGTSTETVAVGIDGRISTRNNSTGIWTIQTFTGNPDFRDVIYANGQYVTVREAGGIMTSPDGLTWASRTSGTANDLRSLLWDGSRYLAVGQNGTILTSSNGVAWTSQNSGSSTFFNSISYSGSQYVAVGGFGIRISSNGVSWSAPTSQPLSISFEASTWDGSKFIIGGLGFGSTATLYSSTNGQSWTVFNSTIKDNIESAISLGADSYIVGAINGSGRSFVSVTANGTPLSNTFTSTNSSVYLNDITYNGKYLISVGFNNSVYAAQVIPEPSSCALIIVGLGGILLALRGRRALKHHRLE